MLLPLLMALALQQPEVRIETGEINGAGYRIDVPPVYNGTLVIYCHGYGGATKFDSKPLAPQIRFLTDLGFAVAQSGYSTAGWAVKEALEDSEALRRHFTKVNGKPKRTVVMGHSMGGVISLATIEKYPESYDAALPICGPIEPSVHGLKRRVFDSLVVADYYFPGIAGSPVDVKPPSMNDFQKAFDAAPEKLGALQKWMGLNSPKEVPPVLAFFARIQQELIDRAGGNAFDNRNTLYFGSPDDFALNRGVKRYAAHPRAAEYMTHYYTPTGRLTRPTLVVHTLYDQLVPNWAVNAYDEMVRTAASESNYLVRWVARAGHCTLTPQETKNALLDLLAWQESGRKPEGGEQK